jgi:hypothetical protein
MTALHAAYPDNAPAAHSQHERFQAGACPTMDGNAPFAESDDAPAKLACGALGAVHRRILFPADGKPVVASLFHFQNPTLRSLDRTLEMGGRVWSMQ